MPFEPISRRDVPTSRENPPLWNPRTGIFDSAELRLAIVMRGWTVVEFATVAHVSRGCLYHALLGHGVTDRTAIRIFRALGAREPLSLSL
jgi:hypothetical protein